MGRDILSREPVPASARIAYGKSPYQFFDIFAAPGTNGPPAIMIHGGFWRSAYDLKNASHLCAALAKTGIPTVSLEYRRVGETGGGWPTTFNDIQAGFKAAREHFAAASDPVVMGHSAGGHLALRLACEKLPIRGVVALAPVGCLKLGYAENLGSGAVSDFLGGTPNAFPKAYADADPSAHASTIPRVLIHGTHDDIVPIANSHAFLEVRRGDAGSVHLVEVAGADHFDVIDPSSHAWPIVLANVKKFLL